MNKQEQLFQIRTRKLGLLIYDARTARRRTVEETSAAVGITGEQLQSYEKGESAPSMPVLESLAFYLDVPIDHFFAAQSLSEKVEEDPIQQKERLRQLRDRIIGATLRMHRSQLNFSLREVASATSIAEEQLKKYEQGELPVSLPELELLAKTYEIRMEEFFDQKGPIGKRRAEQTAVRLFLELPPQLQDFVCKPVNKPYLVLASRLSELSVEKLRAVAEGLLEITY